MLADHPPATQVALTMFAILAVVGVTLLTAGPLGGLQFFVALAGVTLIALILGRGAALAAIPPIIIVFLFFLEPRHTLSVSVRLDWHRVAGFGALAVMIAFVGGSQRSAKRRLAAAARDLEARVAARTRELTTANEKLAEHDRNRNDFLAILSHELRNPLAPIVSSLHLIKFAPAEEQRANALAIVERQVAHLVHLVDDLLDVTRISQGKVRLRREDVELGPLLYKSAETLREACAARGICFTVTGAREEAWVHADQTRLHQIVGNLLQNAVKFTPAGGRIDLSWEVADGSVTIHVRDDGSGIAPEVMPRLFQPFVQADASLDRSRGGLGIGLSVVKALVEMHGGDVSVSSAGVGRGSEFSIRLPLSGRPSAAAQLETPGDRPKKRRRILVIEDNSDAAASLKEALLLHEHEVEVASSGAEGLAKARSQHPDVVLCDLGLPQLDGFEVARLIRADPSMATAFLVALSGYASRADVDRALDAGFDLHLAKPMDVGSLERVLLGAPSRVH